MTDAAMSETEHMRLIAELMPTLLPARMFARMEAAESEVARMRAVADEAKEWILWNGQEIPGYKVDELEAIVDKLHPEKETP